MIKPTTKRYLNVNTLTVTLPIEFTTSPNKKWIEIVSVDFFMDDSRIDDDIEAFERPKFIGLHSNLVQDYRELDCFVQMVNTKIDGRLKYEQLSQQDKIEFWFHNINDEKLDKNSLVFKDGFYYFYFTNPLHFLKIKFVIKLLLIY